MTRIRYCFIRMTSVVNGITDCFRTKCWHVLVFCRVLVFEVNKILKNNLIDIKIKMYEGTVEIFSLFYSRSETQDKRPLGREQDRSWCHRHTSVKLSWSQPMNLWTERQHTHTLLPMSMEPWAAAKQSFTLVWRWHQLLSWSLLNGYLFRVSRRL